MTFEEAYRKYLKQMQQYFRFRLKGDGSQAEEMASDLFYRLFIRWDSLASHDEASIIAWLYTTARTRLVDAYRAAGRTPAPISLEQHLAEKKDICDPCDRFWEDVRTEDEKYCTYLDEIRQHLTAEECQVFEYRVARGCSVSETARALGITENAVSVRMYRLRRKLRPIVMQILERK